MKRFSILEVMFLSLASCSKHNGTPAVPQNPDVYAAGSENNGTHSVAKVWKNGAAQVLTDGSMNTLVRDVYVVGSDVYGVGVENNGMLGVAKLWKNGVAQPLTDGSHDAFAYAVFVK